MAPTIALMNAVHPQALARQLRTLPSAEAARLVSGLDRKVAEQALGALSRMLLGAGPVDAGQRERDDAAVLFLQIIAARYDHVVERAEAGQLFAVGSAVRAALVQVIEARRRAVAGPSVIPIDPTPGAHRPGWW